ncbi:unnamed protein product [Heligmosomoides polygyrus]|uniref:ACB domain-containing protein n=1 Tax=Heligmosomoides polygyrus TaxID=6339 RepID=A0A3P8D5C4_HELPZ|nr:unnamed protein product [Heligmosomoides polygyrus]
MAMASPFSESSHRSPEMPLSELEKKWTGMDFDIAAEEMRRLKKEPTDEEKLVLYGLYKQAIHEVPTEDEIAIKKYKAWAARKGQSKESAQEEYVRYAEEMIRRYHRHIHRCKWNSEVWTVDY